MENRKQPLQFVVQFPTADPSAVWLTATTSYDIFWGVLMTDSISLVLKSKTNAKTLN